MVLSINTSAENNANRDENNSLGKRKSHDGRERGSNLSDVESATLTTTSKPPKPHGTSTPSTLKAHRLNAANRFNSASKFKPRPPSKEEIQATDDKQATVNQSVACFEASSKKTKKPPIHHPSGTPISFHTKPRIKREDVEATDDKRVSVKTLSSWMSNDPFEQKKVRTIRSGSNIIAKSRVFEQDKVAVQRKECGDIRAGSVEERQAWLSGAFKHEQGEGTPQQPSHLQENVIRPYQQKRESTPAKKELKSVHDKAEWLSGAFKKGGGEEQHHSGGTPAIHQTKSFEVSNTNGIPSIMKCASADDTQPQHAVIRQSVDKQQHVGTQVLDRQQSVVRLYQTNTNKEAEESPESTALKSVHDKQAWLSNAFGKPNGKEMEAKKKREGPLASAKTSAVVVDENEVKSWAKEFEARPVVDAAKPASVAKETENTADHDSSWGVDNMSVADRAKWLKSAFK